MNNRSKFLLLRSTFRCLKSRNETHGSRSRNGSLYKQFRSISNSKTQASKQPFRVLSFDKSVETNSAENSDHVQRLRERFQQATALAQAGGGEKATKRLQKQNKMMVLDRVKCFLDDPDDFLELSMTAGIGMEYGNVSRAGVMTVIGRVHGKMCMIIANDGSVKGGTIFPVTLRKQLRAQEIAEQNRLPTVYIIESGGAFLPLQSEIFPDKNQGGRSFYNEAVMSAKGIPQIAVVCGSCTAGGAYVPTMADEAVIVHKNGTIFLGGPPLVQAATGEIVSAEDLGGATMHCTVSGCTDYFAEDEKEALETARDIIASLNCDERLNPGPYEEPLYSAADLASLVSHTNSVDIYKVIASIVDGSRFHEYKKRWGTSLVTGFAYIHGYLVGIVGNNGNLTEYGADKGSNFVQICEERDIPLIFLQNTNSKKSEVTEKVGEVEGNRLRGHAKMLSAVSCTRVPKITFIIGNAIGCESYVMGGRCTSPNFLFCWPNAVIGMSDPMESVAELCQMKFSGSEMNDEEKEAFRKKTTEKCITESSSFYAASRVWNDGLILPEQTRKVAHRCIEAVLAYRQPTSTESFVLRM